MTPMERAREIVDGIQSVDDLVPTLAAALEAERRAALEAAAGEAKRWALPGHSHEYVRGYNAACEAIAAAIRALGEPAHD